MSAKLEVIRARMEKGQALYLGKQYESAAAVFEEGFADTPYTAFLFNAGVCYQKLGRNELAITKFKAYLSMDPKAPDADKVAKRIADLEALVATPPVDGTETTPVAPPPATDEPNAMKSLAVVETEPPGAPIRLFSRTELNAAPFVLGQANAGWKEIVATRSPANLTLDVGRYHVVVEKFQDFNESQTDFDILPGHVQHFKANLSQGAFMGYLRVSSSVPGAHVYIDDPERRKSPWGFAPHGELVVSGKHSVVVEAPGYDVWTHEVVLSHGEQTELTAPLQRVHWGTLRIDANAPLISASVDGKAVGSWRQGSPPLEVRLDSGPHRVVVAADGRKTFEGTVQVPRGQALPVHVGMVPTYPRGTAWAQSAIGAVFVGAGIYFGLESNSIYDELEADRKAGVLDESDSRATKGQIFAISADAGFAVGGVLAALATYNFLRDPLPESAAKLDPAKDFEDPLLPSSPARAVPLKPQKPLAWARPRPATASLAAVRRAPFELGLTPTVVEDGGALMFGGRF